MSDLDKFSYHEALDRTSIAREHFFDDIESHPAIRTHKKLRKKAHKIGKLLGELYQDVARTADDVHK